MELFKAEKCHFHPQRLPCLRYLDPLQPRCAGSLPGLTSQWQDHGAPGQPVTAPWEGRARLASPRSSSSSCSGLRTGWRDTQGPGHPSAETAENSEAAAHIEKPGSSAGWVWGRGWWGDGDRDRDPPESDPCPAVRPRIIYLPSLNLKFLTWTAKVCSLPLLALFLGEIREGEVF